MKKKIVGCALALTSALIITGCGEEKVSTGNNSNSNNLSNIVSNIQSNINSNDISNIVSNITSNMSSNVTSNTTSNVTSNVPVTGNSTLNCSMSLSEQGMSVVSGIVANFSNDKLSYLKMKMTYSMPATIASGSKAYMNAILSQAMQQYNTANFKVSANAISNNSFYLNIEANFAKMTADEKKKLNIQSSQEYPTYSQYKADLIKAGYSCK